MNAAAVRQSLFEQVVAVPTTIWRDAGVLDLDANVANARFLFAGHVKAAVYAGGVGEHDRLSVEQQTQLLTAVAPVVADAGASFGSGLGRTVERVRQLAPALADAGVQWAMLVNPDADDAAGQIAYYSEVITILTEHGVAPVLYPRPEKPMAPATIEALFDRFDIPGVKLANNGLLMPYAEMVQRLGHERSAWMCGTAGWWMPSYFAPGAARGMSSGIVNAFPDRPLALLRRVLDGSFDAAADADYWTMVRLEQLRQRARPNLQLVIKHLQELVGCAGGINGDGAELDAGTKAEAEKLVRDAGWLD